MASDILQKFLDQRLLNLGDDNERFEYLTKAAAELCDLFREDAHALVSATSVMLGGVLPETDSTYVRCDNALKRVWHTYRQRFTNNVDMLLRAAVLQAISTLVTDENNVYAAVVYYTASGLMPHLSTHTEARILEVLYRACAMRVEEDANALWSPNAARAKHDVPKLDAIDADALFKQLAAAGNPAGDAGDNPHALPGAPVDWMNHFAKGAADAIRNALRIGLQDVATKMTTKLNAALGAQAAAENHKANLLYWKTALYHNDTQQSFRDMKHDVAINYMAYDLHLLVPSLHPRSVEYFLREAVRDAIGGTQANKKLTLLAYCESLAGEALDVANRPDLRNDTRITPGRAVWFALARKASPADVVPLTSIPPSATMSRADWAVEIFRDYQLHRLAEELTRD